MNWRKFAADYYAATISTIAIILSVISLLYTKASYDLSAAKDIRELMDKQPAIDIQMRPTGVSTLALEISVANRSDVDITPLDVVVEHSFDAGSLYLANERQSIDKLSGSLSLTSMGRIEPKARKIAKATLAGVTDGKLEQFTPGLEIGFTVRVRLADQQDTIFPIKIARRILPPLVPRLDPTPEIFLSAIINAQKAQKDRERLYLIGGILAAIACTAALAYLGISFKRRNVNKAEIEKPL